MTSISSAELSNVRGGAGVPDPNHDNAFGRCGPGTSWSFLGNVYTPECKAHDAAVRTSESSGDPKWMAHLKALPLLPAAVGSYFRAIL